MEIEEKSGIQDLQPRNFSLGAGSPKPAAPSGKITVVGLDDDLMEIKTRLVRESRELEIVSHVGMGGIGKGKTTLAREVYDDPYILYQLDSRAWVTISQSYQYEKP
ncbi:Disease resistance RPP13-like protein 4 [Abeliophyllum distichum]|uniref:Disease resistance RPP13-like protein 4 n=1 Tax=Abeliophyllum distichum TaxID=126358 RepID=A0ABD1UIZ4_9LAMI